MPACPGPCPGELGVSSRVGTTKTCFLFHYLTIFVVNPGVGIWEPLRCSKDLSSDLPLLRSPINLFHVKSWDTERYLQVSTCLRAKGTSSAITWPPRKLALNLHIYVSMISGLPRSSDHQEEFRVPPGGESSNPGTDIVIVEIICPQEGWIMEVNYRLKYPQ